MACGCAAQLPTYLQGGAGVTVTGLGTEQQPYRITAATSESALNFTDTTTVDLSKTGAGTAASPFEVSARVILDPQGALVAGAGGLGIGIDGNAGNILTITSGGKLRASGSAAVLVAADGGIKDTEFGLAVKLDPASPLAITGTNDGLRVAAPDMSAVTAMSARLDFIQHMQLAQHVIVAGHQRQANATHVSWGSSFFVTPPRRSSDQSSAFYEVGVPAVGTVITGVGGAQAKTVPSSGSYTGMVPLADWESVWYLLPTGQATSTFVPGNLRVASYTAAFAMPDNAIFICSRSGGNDKSITWGDGQRQFPWLSSGNGLKYGSTTIGSITQKHNYRLVNGECEIDYFGVITATQNVTGLLSLDSPVANPSFDAARNYHNHVGIGRLYSSPSGSKAAWEYILQPYIPNGGSAIYFLVARQASQSNVGGVTPNTTWSSAVPRIDEGPVLTMSTEISFQMRFPYLNAPT